MVVEDGSVHDINTAKTFVRGMERSQQQMIQNVANNGTNEEFMTILRRHSQFPMNLIENLLDSDYENFVVWCKHYTITEIDGM